MSEATGRRFVAVCPADSLPWYQPPKDRSQEAGVRSRANQHFVLTAAGLRTVDY
jgi:hypothetical protein